MRDLGIPPQIAGERRVRIMGTVSNWVEERTGISRLISALRDEPLPGGARLAYAMGGALLFLFVLQVATGIVLALYYVPSADHAHASVAYIHKVVPMGGIIRGLHVYGSSVMIILLLAHLLRAYLFGAYKDRRELLWIAGLLTVPVVIGLAFTGHLLNWDQAAYFGTKVLMGEIGEVPGVGQVVRRIFLGGPDVTTLTLSRFFVLHVFLLPLLLVLLVAAHLYLIRRVGRAGPYQTKETARVEPYYPRQLFKDTLVVFVVFLALLVFAVGVPAELGPQADPASDFLGRPPWYLLPLYQLLQYFPGKLAIIPTVVLPMAILIGFFLLPFLDRRPERHPLRRPIAVSVMAVLLVGSVGLGVVSKLRDAADPEMSARFRAQKQETQAFLRASFIPQEIGRSVPIMMSPVKSPLVAGERVLKIYFANCAHCHGADGLGGPVAPALVKLAQTRKLSRQFIIDYVAGHNRDVLPGSMPRFKQLAADDLAALADWLLALDKPIAAGVSEPASASGMTGTVPTGAQAGTYPPPPPAFVTTCALCHGSYGEGKIGPPLIGVALKPRRSREDLLSMLEDSRQYGLKDPMPAHFPTLSIEQRQQIVDWLLVLR